MMTPQETITANELNRVEVAAAVDLDFTLINSLVALEGFKVACAAYGFNPDEITGAELDAKKEERSFDPITYLRSREISEEQIALISDHFVENARAEDILYPDTDEFINSLIGQNVPFFIFTYGPPEWQALKLRASGLDIYPSVVTQDQDKSKVIKSWQQGREDNSFLLPLQSKSNERGEIIATTLVFIDDKPSSTKNLPAGVLGVHLDRPESETRPSQAGELDQGVQRVENLLAMLALISLHQVSLQPSSDAA
jgi:hypothetical protein